TKAKFLHDPTVKTPVFVRFSTVVGFRGSADTVRDVRGMATKFYTEEGNYDLVNNNMGVFFIQDAIKFPDIIHANKPEPHNEIPQATAAHDTFWDFVINNQETAHQVMWIMSDRGIPRSFRMMEGFSINTFRFVNDKGVSHFVRFHWKPMLGVHSLVWDEAQKIAGKDPDYNRRDLFEAIECGNFPEWELGVQILKEEEEFNFDFDILDPTKVWPEEEIPVKIIGKMTLNRNVDNFFAETEQVAFHPGHVVPGIDFTNDPLLQGRLFSYTDTQLIRLGGPNFHEIPINKPIVPVHNNQRDGYHRQMINIGKVSYHRNSLANDTPTPISEDEGGYRHYQEKVDGRKIQARSDSFKDHFSQATMFWNSMSEPEKEHIVGAFSFEVGKVKSKYVKQQVVEMFSNVSVDLANRIAENLGVSPPENQIESNITKTSPALSMENTITKLDTRKVAIILANGFKSDVIPIIDTMRSYGLDVEFVGGKLGMVQSQDNNTIEINHTFLTADSVLFDAVYAVGGNEEDEKFNKDALYFIEEAFKHYKPIGASFDGKKWLQENNMAQGLGVVVEDQADELTEKFFDSILAHRHWNRIIY
ncbi:MAG: catalase, partial [Tissierella sp.]|nr:catalase [Tissierella sp.]